MITVLKPGLLTTVQDAGRPGYRAFGMPVAGALDADAYAAANVLAGNEAGAAALELTLFGGTFRFEIDGFVGLAGADLHAKLDGASIPAWSCFAVPAGATLSFSGAGAGVRAYLAVRGGIDVPVVLGSRATYTRARVGGLQGRALVKGDVLQVGSSPARPSTGSGRAESGSPSVRAQRVVNPVRPERSAERGVEGRPAGARILPASLVPSYDPEVRLRVVLGPQDDRFPPESIDTFLGSSFAVSNRNDRMGYVLEGPKVAHAMGADIVSDGIVPGSVQVPGSGLPIVMMADCATVGGYTKIATTISADLPRLAQAKTGVRVRFARCTQAEAVTALRQRQTWLADIERWASGDTHRAEGEDA